MVLMVSFSIFIFGPRVIYYHIFHVTQPVYVLEIENRSRQDQTGDTESQRNGSEVGYYCNP